MDWELLALRHGLRKAMRTVYKEHDIGPYTKQLKKLGFSYHFGKYLYAARDEATLQRVIALDVGEPYIEGDLHEYLARVAKKDRELGELFGYPSCCVEAFIAFMKKDFVEKRKRGSTAQPNYIAHSLDNSKKRMYPFVVNNISPERILSHMLCSYDCQASRGLANTLYMKMGLGRFWYMWKLSKTLYVKSEEEFSTIPHGGERITFR